MTYVDIPPRGKDEKRRSVLTLEKKMKFVALVILTLGLAQGCTSIVDEECNNSSSVEVEEGCPSSRDHFPRRRQGSGTW